MLITATHITYLHVCHRKLWLFSHGITMEHESELVIEGKLIEEGSYNHRSEQFTEVELEGIKIDFYDPKRKVVHEIKKSDKMEPVHIAQVKYYIYVLEENGIFGARGVLEYPKLRETTGVALTEADRVMIPEWREAVTRICEGTNCPGVVHQPFCKSCAYYEFCYVDEV